MVAHWRDSLSSMNAAVAGEGGPWSSRVKASRGDVCLTMAVAWVWLMLMKLPDCLISAAAYC